MILNKPKIKTFKGSALQNKDWTQQKSGFHFLLGAAFILTMPVIKHTTVCHYSVISVKAHY